MISGFLRLQFIFIFLLFFIGLQVDATFHFASRDSRVRLNGVNSKLMLNTSIVGWNGTLEIADNSENRISGQIIKFDSGILEVGGLHAFLTGTYDSDGGDRILMGGNGRLRADPGSILQSVEISGTGNLLEGQPRFSSAITMTVAPNTGELNLALQSRLNKNIVLNNGKIILYDDLLLSDGVKILGPGTLDVNGRTLELPGSVDSAWDTHLTFSNANGIELNAKTTLQNIWTFTHSEQDASGESHINGNGEILDISSSSAVINVADYHTLYITDCYLKGLGDTTGTFSLMGNNSVVRMSNVTVGMADNYTFDHGQIYVDGTNCTFVTGGFVVTFTWNEADSTVDGNKVVDKGDPQKIIGSLTVDGVKLYYDVLNQSDANNIRPYESDNEYLKLVNNGVLVRSLGGGTGSTIITNAYYNVTRNIDTGEGQELYFNKRAGESTWNITVDGNGYYIHFPSVYSGGSDKPINIDDNLNLTFKNVVLKDFDPSFIKSGAGSNYYFDDGTIIELARNEDLTETWSFIGDCIVDGQCSALNLSCPNAITVADSKTLTLKDLRLTGLRDGANLSDYGRLNCHGDASKLKLQKCDFILDADYTFTVGAIDVYEDVKISGDGHTMIYGTKGIMSIKSDAELIFDRGFTFKYQANFDVGVGSYQNSRNRIQLVDASARLHLYGCTLHSTRTGIMLNLGNLIIDDKAIIKSDAVGDDEAPEFGNSLTISVLAGSVLELDSGGRLKV